MNRPYTFALAAARNRNRVYEAVLKALECAASENNLTRKGIAEAMGRRASQVSTTLSGPSNWTLDTISDLLRAAEAEMEYSVIFDHERVKANEFVSFDESISNLPTAKVAVVDQNINIHTRGQHIAPPTQDNLGSWAARAQVST